MKQLRTLDMDVHSKDYKAFVTEAELMSMLPPHPNVVRFVGVIPPPK